MTHRLRFERRWYLSTPFVNRGEWIIDCATCGAHWEGAGALQQATEHERQQRRPAA